MKKLQLTPNLTRIQFDSTDEWLEARKGILLRHKAALTELIVMDMKRNGAFQK